MNPRIPAAVLPAILAILPTAKADDGFFLKGGETVVFFGDSITQSGCYVEYVDAFLRTRFPDKTFQVINRGISSETISGTSEPDHQPRRPNAQDRFVRDVVSCKPDVLVACFGMNDGNYYPFDPQRFAQYQAGIRQLIARTRDEAKARLVLLTPPPYDPYRRKVADATAKEFGYKFPAIDYDATLEQYSRWLLTLGNGDLIVADVHSTLREHLQRRRATQVSFALSEDGVHPNPTGHWLMAQALLLAWNVPPLCSEVTIDAAEAQSASGDVSDVRSDAKGLSWTWRTPLPMPADPRWDPESIALEDVSSRLNRHRLTVKGTTTARYQLFADGKTIAPVSREELNEGLDLLRYPAFPTVQLARQVLAFVQERQKLTYTTWRESIGTAAQKPKSAPATTSADTTQQRAAEIDARLRELCRPKAVQIWLVPLKDK
jgi:lysophospholipase L1-like esterase